VCDDIEIRCSYLVLLWVMILKADIGFVVGDDVESRCSYLVLWWVMMLKADVDIWFCGG
jgi:hypothetical protein